MTIRVLVNDFIHRTLALATETHVLFFRHTHTPPKQSSSSTSLPLQGVARRQDSPRCMVEFGEKRSVDLKGFHTLSTAKGTLGLITLNNDVFICVVTGSTEVATVRPGETVQKIFAVEFYCLNRADYDYGAIPGYEPNPYPNQVFATDDTNHGSNHDPDGVAEHPFSALKKLLSGGNFYYSLNFDLTRRLQDRAEHDDTVDITSFDQGLLWNSYMIDPLLSFRSRLSDNERAALDHSGMLTSVIRGFAQTLTIPPSSSPIRQQSSNYPATLTVISRMSSRRAGTRFNSRGIDDVGNVANFVETETVFWSPTGICFSYVQIRGSVPVFWESSSSLLPGQQKTQITRSAEATQMSFDRHFEMLERTYGAVHVVNLLSPLKPGEVELIDRYKLHISRSPLRRQEKGDSEKHDLLKYTEFDFHEHARAAGGYDGAKQIRPYIEGSAEGFVYFLNQEVEGNASSMSGRQQGMAKSLVVMQQNGVFRVNCLDCLDRTNLIQGLVSQMALELFLEHRGENPRGNNVFWLRHSSLWADNGDALSKIYAGTGALKSSFTRHGKMSLGGLMADARKSATRLYVNHFEDKGRQNTVDLLLGRLMGQGEVELFDPVNDWVVEQLSRRRDEYESAETVRIWVGTYNLNGKMMTDIKELGMWLDVRKGQGYEIVAVGFQEIVELSPQQIMSTDPGRRVVWEAAVKECLNGSVNENFKNRSDDDYVLLRSGQLVGAALMIFVKVSALSKIRSVEGAIKKTGMSGMAGNKGAVAIRMDIEGTSVCFVTAHLAAGFGNYEERNRDYQTITSGLRFQRDRSIDDHEHVIWAGDFNYRIGLTYERARTLVGAAQKGMKANNTFTDEAETALGTLYENDQLNIQMVVGHCFQFFQEGRVRFLPTYKFDLGKDDYDSSEKARIPAWTDRILWRVKPGAPGMKMVHYTSVQGVRFSDHRPVMASFEMGIKKIDEAKKSQLTARLYEKRQKEVKNTAGTKDAEADHSPGSDAEDDAEELMGYQSIQEGLPPASSDRRKWWLDGDKPVQSEVGPPREGMVLNEGRNGNPWRENGEDEWIEVEKGAASSRNGSTGSPKPQLPPPRRGAQKKGELLSKEAVRLGTGSTEMEMRSVKTPPPPPSSRRSGPLSRSASVASTATTSTMMTAKSGLSQSEVKSNNAPPPKPTKPVALRSASSNKLSPTITSLPKPNIDPTAMATSSKPSPVMGATKPFSKATQAKPQQLQREQQEEQPPPPLPQRTATTTLTSLQSVPVKKTPPPIQPRGSIRQQSQPRPPRENSASSTADSAKAPGSPSASVLAQTEDKPSLPPRSSATFTVRAGPQTQSQTQDRLDLLDQDSGEMDANKWKPLTPGS